LEVVTMWVFLLLSAAHADSPRRQPVASLAAGLPAADRALALALADIIAQDLASAGVPVVSRHGWEMWEASPPIVGAEVLVHSSVTVTMSRATLRVRATNVSNGRALGEWTENGDYAGVLVHTHRIAASLTRALGHKGTVMPATESLPAALALGRALGALNTGDREAARAALQEALSADPHFARAQAILQRVDDPRPLVLGPPTSVPRVGPDSLPAVVP
jgi:hypothetical protein